MTPRAFARGSAFTRAALREREQMQLDFLAERMQSDITALSLQAATASQTGASQALAVGETLLKQLKTSRAVGRLIIDLPGLLTEGKGSAKDVFLRNGDVLIVPPRTQEVTVIGEVHAITSHLYNSSLSRDEYFAASGGTTRKSDSKRTYVVRAGGSVVAKNCGFLRRRHEVAIQPGDTIVVPLDTERMPALPFWQAVTKIVYNLAISVAVNNSF